MTPRQTDASAAGLEAGDKLATIPADLNEERRPSARSLHALDWLNFLLAHVQSGVGPFLAIYLAGHGWNEERVGVALTVGGIAGIASQTPAGALVDRLRSKRALIALGVCALALGALLIALLSVLPGGRDSANADGRRDVQSLHARHRRHLARPRGASALQSPPGTKPDLRAW
jgi:hypothetical protein